MKKKYQTMASQNQRVYSLFGDYNDDEMDIIDKENNSQSLHFEIFDQIDTELQHLLIHDDIIEIDTGDDTDGPIDLLKQVVQKVKTDFECVPEDPSQKKLSSSLLKSSLGF